MNRRGYLTVCGTLCGGLAGCSGNSKDSSEGTAGPARDGYPPESGTTPTDRTIDTSAFETTTVEGVDVPLAPIDATHHWYRGRAARFVDARGQAQYDRSHITGAVLSPAPDGTGDDPVEAWPTDDRIVCYCGCPHHLSSLRAASLIENGYGQVYVIDEGFWEWQDRGYPISGEEDFDRTGSTANFWADSSRIRWPDGVGMARADRTARSDTHRRRWYLHARTALF